MAYKAKLRGNYPPFTFLGKSIVLPISVGQPYHEGDKFAATLKLLEKMQCSSCSIVVADELQRYNDQLFAPTSHEATTHVHTQGSEWLTRNMKYLNSFSIPYTIVRWNECLSHRNFTTCLATINALKESNVEYRNALDSDINIFVQRQDVSSYTHHDNLKRAQSCQEYLIEETAVLISYFMDAGYDYILYPSAVPRSIDIVLKMFNQTGLQCLRIYFKKTV